MTMYSKLLVARHSPSNGCYAPDGAILFVTPLNRVPLQDHIKHYFLSVEDRKTKSKYGWVDSTDAFSLDQFAEEYLGSTVLSENERHHLDVMLNSIARLPLGAPVAATYSCRGVEKKRMEFTVHRVILHDV